MIKNSSNLFDRLKQDSTFWIIVGALLLLYLILQLQAVIPFLLTLFWLMITITVHEFAHAWAADKLGDPTARFAGRLSLNPLVHLDPVGTVMIVLTALTGFGLGWGKPVPVSPHRLRFGRRKGNALVALAGAVANILLATIVGLLYSWLDIRFDLPLLLQQVLRGLVMTNYIIAFFNLIPLPPLDGYSVLIGLISLSRSSWAFRAVQSIESLRRYGPFVLLTLIILSQFSGLNLFGWLVGRPAFFMYRFVMGPNP